MKRFVQTSKNAVWLMIILLSSSWVAAADDPKIAEVLVIQGEVISPMHLHRGSHIIAGTEISASKNARIIFKFQWRRGNFVCFQIGSVRGGLFRLSLPDSSRPCSSPEGTMRNLDRLEGGEIIRGLEIPDNGPRLDSRSPIDEFEVEIAKWPRTSEGLAQQIRTGGLLDVKGDDWAETFQMLTSTSVVGGSRDDLVGKEVYVEFEEVPATTGTIKLARRIKVFTRPADRNIRSGARQIP